MVQKNERVELAIEIVKYRALARQAPDVETTKRINGLIAKLEQKLREIDECPFNRGKADSPRVPDLSSGLF